VTEGKAIFLFDEDKLPGRELTKAPPDLTDFKVDLKVIETASMVAYVQVGGFTTILKNRFGNKGFVVGH